jgi:hypothetical protein
MSFAHRSVLAVVTMTILAVSAADARELRVCADPNNLPFSNDRLGGFENKIATLIAEELRAESLTLGGRSAAASFATRSKPMTAIWSPARRKGRRCSRRRSRITAQPMFS